MNFQWPDAARNAIAIFFTKWNDIDVFVEDTAGHTELIYRVLINRILSGNSKVEKIFPLGPRMNVIEACQNDTLTTGRSRIYLIDGDLDLLMGRRQAPELRLFQHHVYAIENYLLSEDALIEILQEENPRCSKENIKTSLDYTNWLTTLLDLNKLFVLFAISKELAPELSTIALGTGPFISGGSSPYLDSGKIDKFCNDRKNEILLKVSVQKFNQTENTVQNKMLSVGCSIDLLAARDFVFPILRHWLKLKGIKLKSTNESLQLRLAKVVSLDRHLEFLTQVNATANGR